MQPINKLRQSIIGKTLQRKCGSVMPFIAMAVMFLLGTVGVTGELTRIFETVRQLNFAAQTAALYACSQSANNDGSYSISSAQANIQNAIVNTGTAAWNKAECGPIGNVFASGGISKNNIVWSKPVTFAFSDIQFVSNPLDNNEFFIQVTARRQGADALQQFLLPLLRLYSNPIGTKLQANAFTASPYQTVEVLGQPASRIGAGAPLTSSASNFIGWGTLPLAISNTQFAAISNVSQTATQYTIDLVSPSTSGSVQSGHIRGCLVNVATSNVGNSYYGAGSGNTAISQLINLLNYFSSNGSALPSAVVERGSLLNAFSPTDTAFVSQQTQITNALKQLPHKFYILPVIAADPSFSGSNIVVGFARFNLDSINITGNTITSLTMDIGESIPAYNASCATGFSAIAGNSFNNLLPAPVSPFLPRQFDTVSGGVTVRPRGIILAPALSPRQIKFS